MVKTVKTTLKQLKSFIKNIDSVTKTAMFSMRNVLMEVLYEDIFKSYSNVFEIPSVEALKGYLRTGGMPPVATYSPEYLKQKEARGEYYPHVFENYGFYGNTFAKVEGSNFLRMSVPNKSFFRKGGWNYGELHENSKSVVKGTVLLAWDRLLDTLLETYKEYLQR